MGMRHLLRRRSGGKVMQIELHLGLIKLGGISHSGSHDGADEIIAHIFAKATKGKMAEILHVQTARKKVMVAHFVKDVVRVNVGKTLEQERLHVAHPSHWRQRDEGVNVLRMLREAAQAVEHLLRASRMA